MVDSCPMMGMVYMSKAIDLINRTIREEKYDLDVIREAISKKANHPGLPLHEIALWETYKDFLDPFVNPDLEVPVRSIEGDDAI